MRIENADSPANVRSKRIRNGNSSPNLVRSGVLSAAAVGGSLAVGLEDHFRLEPYFAERGANGAWIHAHELDKFGQFAPEAYKAVYETGNAWWVGIPIGIGLNYLANVLSQSQLADEHPRFKKIVDHTGVRAMTIGLLGAFLTYPFEIPQIAQHLQGILAPSLESGDLLTGAAVTFAVLSAMEIGRGVIGRVRNRTTRR